MLLTLLVAAAATLAPRPALRAPVLPPQGTSEATAEGTEILRRILVDALDQTFEGAEQVRTRQRGLQVHGLVTTLFASDTTVQNSRAFHVPEAGLFFALDVSLPLVKRQGGSEPAPSDQPTDDEWERMRGEVRGQNAESGVFRRLRLATPVALDIDPNAVDQVVDTVLRTLARHAPRVEGLAPRDTFTVALRLSGRHRTLTQTLDTTQGGEFTLGFEPEELTPPGKPESISAFVFATGEDVREQNLTIRIALADLTGLADAGPDKLRARAQVNRY